MTDQQKLSSLEVIRKNISLTMLLGDIVAICFALYSANFLTSWCSQLEIKTVPFGILSEVNKPLLFAPHGIEVVIVGIVFLLVMLGKGFYTQRIPWWCQIPILFWVVFYSALFDAAVQFFIGGSTGKITVILFWLFSFIYILCTRQVLYHFFRIMKLWQIPTIVLGNAHVCLDTLYAFNTDRYTGYDVHTVLLRDDPDLVVDRSNLPKRYENLKIEHIQNNYETYIRNHPDNFYIVTIEMFRGKARDKLMEIFRELGIKYALIPSVKKNTYYEKEPRQFFGNDILLLHSREGFFKLWSQALKRIVDVCASLVLLILISPILVLVPLFLKLEGQSGSPFYGGKRVGKDGKLFQCWKFRTMEPGTDHLLEEKLRTDPEAAAMWKKYHKLEDDPRVQTKTAKFVRKYSIDELPQIWNVFCGHMSLVGPRPILESEQDGFGKNLKQYTSVRPGITGLWQVSGRNDVSFERRVYWDTWYVLNWSFWGDIVILFKTLRVVFGASGAH